MIASRSRRFHAPTKRSTSSLFWLTGGPPRGRSAGAATLPRMQGPASEPAEAGLGADRLGDRLRDRPRTGRIDLEPDAALIVLFDGACAFCNRAVDWLLRRDPEGRLRFAPLQGETAARLRARHPEIPAALETIA